MPEVITWDTKLTYGCENSASVVIYICCTSAAICRITFPGRHYKYFKCFQRKQNLNFISKLQWIQILFASLWVKWWWHGSVCLANLSRLFYTVFYMSLEGTVLCRSLWPLQVLGKVLNSWAKSKRLKKKLFGGFCFCFCKGKNIFPFLGTHSFYSFKNNSRKSTLSRKSHVCENTKLILLFSKTSPLRCEGGKFTLMILRGCTSQAGTRSAPTPTVKGSCPLSVLTACAPVLTGGHFTAEHSGLQAREPHMGSKQFMISGLPRHVLAYTWFL